MLNLRYIHTIRRKHLQTTCRHFLPSRSPQCAPHSTEHESPSWTALSLVPAPSVRLVNRGRGWNAGAGFLRGQCFRRQEWGHEFRLRKDVWSHHFNWLWHSPGQTVVQRILLLFVFFSFLRLTHVLSPPGSSTKVPPVCGYRKSTSLFILCTISKSWLHSSPYPPRPSRWFLYISLMKLKMTDWVTTRQRRLSSRKQSKDFFQLNQGLQEGRQSDWTPKLSNWTFAHRFGCLAMGLFFLFFLMAWDRRWPSHRMT